MCRYADGEITLLLIAIGVTDEFSFVVCKYVSGEVRILLFPVGVTASWTTKLKYDITFNILTDILAFTDFYMDVNFLVLNMTELNYKILFCNLVLIYNEACLALQWSITNSPKLPNSSQDQSQFNLFKLR